MNPAETISITVNGEPLEIALNSTIADLISHLEISRRGIAVERNHEIEPADRFTACVLQPGDVLEIVTLVGGG
jgi:thiamine biosynthesis protein ThiS